MISYAEAICILRASASTGPTELIDTCNAVNRIMADDFHAPFGLPRFNNSGMDGFALRAVDTISASISTPVSLPVLRAQAAGDPAGKGVAGNAVQIMTGGAIPDGMDSVVPIESVTTTIDASGNVTHIRLTSPVTIHDSIRFAGDDFADGQCLIKGGTRLQPAHIAILYATGTIRTKVIAPPMVSILTTGKEVSDTYQKPLGSTQVYDSNTPYLISALGTAGIPSSYAGHVGDDEARFRTLLTEAAPAQILVSSGAVSKGKWDFIPSVLRDIGAEILFHRVSIKPGKPVLFARLPNNRYFFGLPGNPISTVIGLRFFLMPLLRQILGMSEETPEWAQLAAPYDKTGDLRLFLKSHVTTDPTGRSVIDLLQGQESFKISPFLNTNAWAILDETPRSYNKGQAVMYYPNDLLR